MYKVTAVVMVALGMFGVLSRDAAAKDIVIKQNCKAACLKQACDRVGGSFSSDSNGSAYRNDKKGTGVNCNKAGSCYGWVPDKARVGAGGSRLGGLDAVLKGGAGVGPIAQPGGKGVAGTKQPGLRAPVGGGTFQQPPKSPNGPVLKSGRR